MRDNCIDVRPCTPAEILFGNGPPRFPNRLASNLLFRNRVSHPRFNKTPAQSHGFSRNGSFPASFSFFFFYFLLGKFFFFFFFFSFQTLNLFDRSEMKRWKKMENCIGYIVFGETRKILFAGENGKLRIVRMEWKFCEGVNFCQIFRS